MPASAAVRTSRSPNPKIRPKIDWVSTASLIFSSELSVARLLTTPCDLDDPAVGQDELRVEVLQRRPGEEREAADEQHRRQDAEHVAERAVLVTFCAEDDEQERRDDRRDRDPRAPEQDSQCWRTRWVTRSPVDSSESA